MRVYEGTILTVDAQDSVARYLVEDGGRIVHVGDTLPEEYSSAPREQLENRALCPAFVDTHEHLASFATFNAGLNAMHARSNQQIKENGCRFCRKSVRRRFWSLWRFSVFGSRRALAFAPNSMRRVWKSLFSWQGKAARKAREQSRALFGR